MRCELARVNFAEFEGMRFFISTAPRSRTRFWTVYRTLFIGRFIGRAPHRARLARIPPMHPAHRMPYAGIERAQAMRKTRKGINVPIIGKNAVQVK